MSNKAIVLDANILIRAVLGRQVRDLIFENAATVKFFAPDVAYADARKYLPTLLKKRGVEEDVLMRVLNMLETVVQSIDAEFYKDMQQQALLRIAVRDADDWPVLACAMTLGCPIWTEDADFFGAGVATWTSDRIALYFA
jgi:predicted nucleic acid-binding protein